MKKLKDSSNEVKLLFSRFNNCNFQIWRDSSEVKNTALPEDSSLTPNIHMTT